MPQTRKQPTARSASDETLPEPTPFVNRHIGPNDAEIAAMLQTLGCGSLEQLIERTIPASIRAKGALNLGEGLTEADALSAFREVALRNEIWRSYLGMGYYDTITPPVIQRNILENPGWYTAYTPYQAEIAQGRLEALLGFQTVVIDLTGLPIANASLLDEGTAAAEAMMVAYGAKGGKGREKFFIADHCHPQTISVVKTRGEIRGIEIVVGDVKTFAPDGSYFGVLLQYPATDGGITDWRGFADRARGDGVFVVVASDLLALTLLTPPGEWGADAVVGNSQRFGVPMGYGGPHAGFLSTREEFKRIIPGRIIGVSRDSHGKPALRMALQTREQHIRREKATSNVCTAQVLLAVMAYMYAVYHGSEGLRRIALRTHRLATALAAGLRKLGHEVGSAPFFDTVRVRPAGGTARVLDAARKRRMNLRELSETELTIALDETTGPSDVRDLLAVFGGDDALDVDALVKEAAKPFAAPFARTSKYLQHPVFNAFHSETEMLRYMRGLESRDLSLTYSMIPLGSCTMKLNATSEMYPVTWPELGKLHPFAPREQADGYRFMFDDLGDALKEITGFAAVSLQPNAGSQGEYAGLLAIAQYHASRGDTHRNICLIPQSAHGTNPASAVMAGMEVVVVKTDANGNIDIADLRARAEKHRDKLSALMVTYPSTHGVFEEGIREVCRIVHENGGQVYMDGANMNAMVGLCRPGDIGADVCHLNLHKTFCIPHGGGGPGMGPIGVAAHLAPFLPGHPVVSIGGEHAAGAVSAAPWGSASILPISYMYIKMMGGEGLTQATRVAILNANYIAKRLEGHFKTLYRGEHGTVAHECILDTRDFKRTAGIEVEDIAKRLIDYGFHAPTVSFPVAGTLMVEPTESESKAELDRFCDAMISIRQEIKQVEDNIWDRQDNPLTNAPHTMESVMSTDWTHPYTREQAAFPAEWVRARKFWPAVGRIESAYGDRNLVCSCPPTDAYAEVVAAS